MRKTIYDNKVVKYYIDNQEKFKKELKNNNKLALLLFSIESGHTNQDAVRIAGISESEFYLWLQEIHTDGSDNKYYKPEFSEAMQLAQYNRINYHIQNIRDAGKKDWKASAWWLERTNRERFGKNVIPSLTNNFTQISVEFQKEIDQFVSNADNMKKVWEIAKQED